ncbi:MAG: NADH-ubiquinone oxidoreductase-F iron-sulfur binding region domain-containing protein [Patescibacteria group bacterium]
MPKKENILTQIETAALVGRGGASFSVAQKWAAVKEALRTKKRAYIIANGAEGEPGVKKDGFIIKHFPEELINGIDLADKFLGPQKIGHIYIFLSHEYFKKYTPVLKKVLSAKRYSALEKKIKFIAKPEELTYVSGEESALLNLIEGRKIEPRLKPPYPTSHGLFGSPTLINNVETFYNISLVSRGKFKHERFYTINGAVRHPGVYSLPAELTIEDVLKKTNNIPAIKYFVIVGGEAAGEVLRGDQLERPVEGAGSIMVYDFNKTDRKKLLKYWLRFYFTESCGNCTICREGTYRLWELVNQKKFDKKLFSEIISGLEESSFCALGRSLPIPVKSYFLNIEHEKI